MSHWHHAYFYQKLPTQKSPHYKTILRHVPDMHVGRALIDILQYNQTLTF